MKNSFENPPIEIELATLKDLESYKKIRLEALEKAPEFFGEKLEDAFLKTDDDWRKDLTDTNRAVIIAKKEKEAKGVVRMDIREGKIGFISSMYVTDEFKQRGIAKRMLQEIEKEMKKRGVKKAVLYVGKNPRPIEAIELYKKLSYEFNDNLTKYDKWEGMEKSL